MFWKKWDVLKNSEEFSEKCLKGFKKNAFTKDKIYNKEEVKK